MFIEQEQVIGFDCDDTCVLWREPKEGEKTVDIKDPYDGRVVRLVIHEPHIKLMKDRMARGCAIILWSQAGPKWAKAVADALDLKTTVICAKPFMIVDDLPAADWLKNRTFINPESNYGRF